MSDPHADDPSSRRLRPALFALVGERVLTKSLGRLEVEEINVYSAAIEARRRPVEALQATPGHVSVDEDLAAANFRGRRS